MELAKIFSDNMVFQAEEKIRIFGSGKGTVEIEFLGKIYSETFHDSDWIIYLDACSYGGPYEMKIRLNDEQKILKNVMIGEVILCAGQSNVEYEVCIEKDYENIVENTNVRYFLSDMIAKISPFTSDDGWQVGNREKMGAFSALAFHIADELNKKKNVAVGVVGCFHGASVIRSWLDKESLTEDIYVPISDRHVDSTTKEFALWNEDCALYNHTFLPITPFAFSAVVWYQGESNTSIAEAEVYDLSLQKLINRWRKDLANESLKFIIIEICDYDMRNDEGWKAIQKAQKKATEKIENTVFVTSSDVCAHNDVHPNDKRGLARKVAEKLY